MPTTPFTDPGLVAGPLYATAGRLARRTGALHAAKISGGDATTTTIVDLAAQAAPAAPVVCDIGCGRGTTTLQLAARLAPGGRVVLVTKSADSYHEIDQLIADAGLAPRADNRPSLYESFHSGTAPEITATALRVEQIVHQHHVFRFAGLDHLAAYVGTSPNYRLPELRGEAVALAEQLRRRIPDQPVTTTSTVTYVRAARP